VQQWCVCQWAFASYLANAGGCDQIQDIVCESINIQAVWAYQASSDKYSDALECLVDRCGLDMTNRSLYSGRGVGRNGAAIVWLGVGTLLLALFGSLVVSKRRSIKKEALLPEPNSAPEVGYQSSTGRLA
jgi:hypothetical protein